MASDLHHFVYICSQHPHANHEDICPIPPSSSSLTGPWGVQPVLDVENLLVFRASIGLLTDLIVLGDLLLQADKNLGGDVTCYL